MDPGTLLIAATAFKSIGSLVSGYSDAANLEAQAGAAGYNARLARQNAGTVSEQADLREEQMRREARQVQGGQRAAIAESGTGFEGSNLDIYRQDAALAELDALNTRYEGALARTSYMNEASAQDYQRRSLKKAAGMAKVNAWMSAGAELVGGAGSYMGGMTASGARKGAGKIGASAGGFG